MKDASCVLCQCSTHDASWNPGSLLPASCVMCHVSCIAGPQPLSLLSLLPYPRREQIALTASNIFVHNVSWITASLYHFHSLPTSLVFCLVFLVFYQPCSPWTAPHRPRLRHFCVMRPVSLYHFHLLPPTCFLTNPASHQAPPPAAASQSYLPTNVVVHSFHHVHPTCCAVSDHVAP